MNRRSPFRLLLQMFHDRFFEDDTVSPGSGFETNIYQVCGFLITVGLFVAYLTMPAFLELSFRKAHSVAGAWALRNFRLFLPAFSFALLGFAAVFQWDMLFPNRRDFLVLSVFPVSLLKIFLAKFGALSIFLGLLIASLNLFPTFSTSLFCLFKADAPGFGARLVTAQLAATGGSAVFAFLVVAAFQGILIAVTSPRLFRRVSPWLQTIGMSLAMLSVSTYPVCILLLKSAVDSRQTWLWFYPPVWFTGFYDLLLPGGDPFFSSLALYGMRATSLALLCFCLAWVVGFRRHFRRTLETDDTLARRPARSSLRRLAPSPAEWAIFAFCRKTLARSPKHRLFLATWLSIGISVGVLVAVSARRGKLEWSPEGLRTVPFLISFFVISGFRTAFQFPSDLACNGLLQVTESRWSEVARRATRKTVLVSGLLPVLLAILPFEILAAGLPLGFVHILFQLSTGALLVEIMFWRFDKVPFTCSYFAGRTSLALLFGLYIYGLTGYSFNMADLEGVLEARVLWSVLFFAGTFATLVILGRRNPEGSEVVFDASEPLIQTLDLN